MKKLVSIILSLILLMSSAVMVNATESTESMPRGDAEGFVIDENGTLTAYTGSSLDIVVPDNVKTISSSAFGNLRGYTITLPVGLESIKSHALEGARQIISSDDMHLKELGYHNEYETHRNIEITYAPSLYSDMPVFYNCLVKEICNIPGFKKLVRSLYYQSFHLGNEGHTLDSALYSTNDDLPEDYSVQYGAGNGKSVPWSYGELSGIEQTYIRKASHWTSSNESGEIRFDAAYNKVPNDGSNHYLFILDVSDSMDDPISGSENETTKMYILQSMVCDMARSLLKSGKAVSVVAFCAYSANEYDKTHPFPLSGRLSLNNYEDSILSLGAYGSTFYDYGFQEAAKYAGENTTVLFLSDGEPSSSDGYDFDHIGIHEYHYDNVGIVVMPEVKSVVLGRESTCRHCTHGVADGIIPSHGAKAQQQSENYCED